MSDILGFTPVVKTHLKSAYKLFILLVQEKKFISDAQYLVSVSIRYLIHFSSCLFLLFLDLDYRDIIIMMIIIKQ